MNDRCCKGLRISFKNIIPWPDDRNQNQILLYRLSGCHIKEGVLKLLSSLKESLRELDLQYNVLGKILEKKVCVKVRVLKDKFPLLRYVAFIWYWFIWKVGMNITGSHETCSEDFDSS